MNSKQLRRCSALLGVAAITGVAAIHAHATDALPFACNTGAGIKGEGASFQNAGVQAEITAYASACNGGVANVTYDEKHPGTGMSNFTARAIQFAGTDIPYSDAQWFAMQRGNGSDSSHVETIPIALGAIGVAANESCVTPGTQLSGATIAAIYAGTITTWNKAVAGCPADPIVALHRSGSSGTTSAFKTYLTKKDPADFATGCDGSTCYKDPTSTWPAPGTECDDTNLAMVTCLTTTPGAIAYIDETDAASSGVRVVQVDNAFGTLGFSAPGPGTCTQAAQTAATPTTSAADWSQVDITDGANGYGICAFTYQLAFDNPVTAGAATAAQAKTISNFISYEVSDAGQGVFAANRYDRLPVAVQAQAQAAAQEFLTAN